ncbi:MAG: Hsp20/alpha crystallin family protein [Oscillospiraceae bacterium]|nr:Hsp20/alpha crystallin family protein [Oscillospiraceae bacterium]MBP5169200.1 Hsp20/alpha crystallin family protein [Oscillospiraceae bacterium]
MFELIPFDRRMHRVSNYDPFREMDELFNNASRNIANPFATDVIDNGDSFELNAELPGFKKEDINLSVENDCLTISAERKLNKEEKVPNFIKRERFYGSYSRSFDLTGIDVDKISASYIDGVLKLVLPKEAEEVPVTRSITIH